ncbi:MAG: SMP-30/gluconolactonase/LRE family protein [Chitinophagaceae bacterium]|nr:SMP-30/gluconolactonase/LRE family protein [Chitinophagaceae bacterium]
MLNSQEMKVILEIDAKAQLGEGALWHPIEKKLYWVNIEGRTVHIFDPVTKENKSFFVNERVGTVVPVKRGGALVALQNGIHFLNTETGALQFIANPITDSRIRFNDGKCDPSGRFWVGSMHLQALEGVASLYRMDIDKQVHRVVDGVTISNGIAWTKDRRTMYYVDSPLRRIDAFDYDDADGSVSNRRTIVHIPEGSGSPDGITLDEEGKIWAALWGANAVGRFDPETGEVMQMIHVPAPNVSSCAFGGENLDTLFITTARGELAEEQLEAYPLSGGLFSVKPGVRGIPAEFFTGEVAGG